MDIEVDEKIHMPKINNSIISSVFGKMKVSFVMLLILVVGIYVAIFLILNNVDTNNSIGSSYIVLILEILLWLILIYVVHINIKKYNDDNLDYQVKMENLFNTKISELTVNANTNKADENKDITECVNDVVDGNKEVFHIASNEFTFNEARDICEKYNSRLANYDEIENAYKKGANWCSYGWSKDTLALFPTQKSLYNELKQIPGHENDCGRPGINGGYFKNKELKFGVNCYGIKPKAKKKDIDYTHALNHTPRLTEAENVSKNFESKYIIAPFNKDKWTEKQVSHLPSV
uniref:Link domain-containing protein n=1 Tax=viral metagenome TaxID=1070528 RepID=A0A6C0L0K2_9ZZZZ|tara:strand:+ start:18287 stop:19156 length:870 start_codon:yes stop_codon:yes gene_type:complete